MSEEHFSYDLVGNRLTDAKTGTNEWSYNKNNELQSFDSTSFKYNLNGQLTEKTVAGIKTNFSYNLDGRLKEIKDNLNQVVAQYQYDPFGRRISKTLPKESKTIYYRYSDEGLIAEYNEVGSLIQSYGYKPDSEFTTDPVFTQRPDFIPKSKSGYVYFINDLLGTPQKLITETGRKVWEARADAFGKTIITNNEFKNPLRFPGQYTDEESTLKYNFWRYYDSDLGRYIQTDHIGLDGGINTYVYVKNNPNIFIDPTGEYISVKAAMQMGMSALVFYCSKNKAKCARMFKWALKICKNKKAGKFLNPPGSKGGKTGGKQFTKKQKDDGDTGDCTYCGDKTDKTNRQTDHRWPVSDDGNTTPANKGNSCRTCNRLKSALTPEQWDAFVTWICATMSNPMSKPRSLMNTSNNTTLKPILNKNKCN